MNPYTVLRRLARACSRDPETRDYSRFRLVERIGGLIYPRYPFHQYGRIWLDDEEFRRFYRSFYGDYSRQMDRVFTLGGLVDQATGVEGDTAECGVFKGLSSYRICERIAGSGRRHHIFDSFQGLSTPDKVDGSHWSRGDLSVPLAKVQQRLSRWDFVEYHPGWIPEAFPAVSDKRFCLVHIDVDLHQPTLDSLRFFYPRVTPGGIIVCDDYGLRFCPGAYQAWESFMADKPERTIHCSTGQAILIKR